MAQLTVRQQKVSSRQPGALGGMKRDTTVLAVECERCYRNAITASGKSSLRDSVKAHVVAVANPRSQELVPEIVSCASIRWSVLLYLTAVNIIVRANECEMVFKAARTLNSASTGERRIHDGNLGTNHDLQSDRRSFLLLFVSRGGLRAGRNYECNRGPNN